MKGISAIVAALLMLMITIGLASVAYLYMSNIVSQKTKSLSLSDASCSGTTGTVILRNDGQDTIKSTEQILTSIENPCTTGPTLSDIAAGSSVTYSFTSCAANQYHKYKLTGPANTLTINFRC